MTDPVTIRSPHFEASTPLPPPAEVRGGASSWWREGVRFARWDPLGFGAATFLLLLFVRPYDEFLLHWMLGWAVPALWRRDFGIQIGHQGRAVWVLMAAFLGWMWLGMFRGSREMPQEWLAEGMNVLATALFLAGLWRAALRPSRLEWLLRGLAGVGALTAAVSVGVFIHREAEGMFGGRLENVMVFGGEGLHPVNSGLMWGFAAMASAAALTQTRSLAARAGHGAVLVLLSLAVFLTQTRGAVLGLAAAVIALAALRPLKTWAPVMAVILCAGWASQHLPELLPAGMAPAEPSAQIVARGGPASDGQGPPVTPALTGMVAKSPDNGRFALYKVLWGRIQGAWEVIAGRGFWACDNAMAGEIHWRAPHPHGAFLGTFYHGGLIGLALIVALLWRAGRAGWWLARRNLDARWAVLLACGLAGLVFDGHSLALARTVPMVETLLFWFPLLAGAALAAKVKESLEPG